MDRKTQSDLAHVGYCHYVIKYLMRDVMNCHYQRLSHLEVALEGYENTDSPRGFLCSEPESVHGCSHAKLCHVPVQSTFVEIVPFDNY